MCIRVYFSAVCTDMRPSSPHSLQVCLLGSDTPIYIRDPSTPNPQPPATLNGTRLTAVIALPPVALIPARLGRAEHRPNVWNNGYHSSTCLLSICGLGGGGGGGYGSVMELAEQSGAGVLKIELLRRDTSL